ncbi:MAG: hypothetical protein ACYTBJ_12425 [Planctomycetota bacterium]|jgi:hypothetical protein
MDARRKRNIVDEKQEYELSYLMFSSPASGGGSGDCPAGKGKDVTCLVEIKRSGRPRRLWSCSN